MGKLAPAALQPDLNTRSNTPGQSNCYFLGIVLRHWDLSTFPRQIHRRATLDRAAALTSTSMPALAHE
jgi:hypothetical protein